MVLTDIVSMYDAALGMRHATDAERLVYELKRSEAKRMLAEYEDPQPTDPEFQQRAKREMFPRGPQTMRHEGMSDALIKR